MVRDARAFLAESSAQQAEAAWLAAHELTQEKYHEEASIRGHGNGHPGVRSETLNHNVTKQPPRGEAPPRLGCLPSLRSNDQAHWQARALCYVFLPYSCKISAICTL